jgi:hypothetical protein
MKMFFSSPAWNAISLGDLILALLLSTLVFWGVELEKWLARDRYR